MNESVHTNTDIMSKNYRNTKTEDEY